MDTLYLTVKADGSINWTAPAGYTGGKVTNELKRFDISFDKVFEGMDDGEVIPGGAEFTIYDSTGTTALTTPGETGTNPVAITNNGDTVTFTDVVPGTYVIKETKTPAGYKTIDPITVTVSATGNVTGLPADGEVDNERCHCSIIVTKSGLQGSDTATFTLYDSVGNPVGSVTVSAISPTNGWTDLCHGDYYVAESTLAGYDIPTWTINPGGVTGTGNRMPGGTDMITIGEEVSDFTISVINTKHKTITGSITLNKTGLASTAIAGFTLYNSKGAAVVPEKTVTGSGSVSWGGLPYGTYYIVETNVPDGYTKMDDITGIVIGPGTMTHSFTRSNTTDTTTTVAGIIEVAGITELPFTGMDPFIPISGMAMMIVGAVMIALSVARRRKWKHELINDSSTSD